MGESYSDLYLVWPKNSVRDICLADDPMQAEVLLEKVITGGLEEKVPEIRSLGRTLDYRSTECRLRDSVGLWGAAVGGGSAVGADIAEIVGALVTWSGRFAAVAPLLDWQQLALVLPGDSHTFYRAGRTADSEPALHIAAREIGD